MARPRSDDKRSAILSAAIHIIAVQGLAAATATIAKEAGVSNGSLFTYFETKASLLNHLYVILKTEMARTALDQLPTENNIRQQTLYMWSHWLLWGMSYPEKRRTLAHLEVSDEITSESRQAVSQALTPVKELLERSCENGPLRDAPLEFTVALMNGLADTTIAFMSSDPINADNYSLMAFDAFWRMIA